LKKTPVGQYGCVGKTGRRDARSYGNPFFLRGLRILSRFALRMTSRLVVANTIRRADKLSFSCHCEAVQTAVAIRSLLRVLRILSRFAFRMTGRLVIAKVRVSGGHLCKAEAPTEPAGET